MKDKFIIVLCIAWANLATCMRIILQTPDKQYHIINEVQTGITLGEFIKLHVFQYLNCDRDCQRYTFHRGKQHIMDPGCILYNNDEITIKLHPDYAG